MNEMKDIVKERIQNLCEIHKVPLEHFTCKAKIYNYTRGLQKYMDLNLLVDIADFFGVSVDYLLGRVDELDKDYQRDIEELYLKSYESYLRYGTVGRLDKSAVVKTLCSSDVISPWPYNLLEYAKIPLEMPLTQEQIDNIIPVMEKFLTKREYLCTLMYFKDDITLTEIAKTYNVTKERIRQIIAKACRKLRHPAYAVYIRYGFEVDEMIKNYYIQAREEYAKKQAEAKLSFYKAANDVETCEIVGIEELELSVRSYNALIRNKVTTVKELVDIVENDLDRLLNFRNLGRKSLEEILDKVSAYTEGEIKFEKVN